MITSTAPSGSAPIAPIVIIVTMYHEHQSLFVSRTSIEPPKPPPKFGTAPLRAGAASIRGTRENQLPVFVVQSLQFSAKLQGVGLQRLGFQGFRCAGIRCGFMCLSMNFGHTEVPTLWVHPHRVHRL